MIAATKNKNKLHKYVTNPAWQCHRYGSVSRPRSALEALSKVVNGYGPDSRAIRYVEVSVTVPCL